MAAQRPWSVPAYYPLNNIGNCGRRLHGSFHIHWTLSELSNPANGENQWQPYFYRLNPNTSKRLIFTVMGGMVLGLLKLIQITADEPFPNQSGVDSNYFSIGGPAQHPYQTDASSDGTIAYCPLDELSRPTCAYGILTTESRLQTKQRGRQDINIDPTGWPEKNQKVTITDSKDRGTSYYGWRSIGRCMPSPANYYILQTDVLSLAMVSSLIWTTIYSNYRDLRSQLCCSSMTHRQPISKSSSHSKEFQKKEEKQW